MQIQLKNGIINPVNLNVKIIVKILIALEDFDLDNILIDEKSHENILIYNISYKTNWFKTFAN